MTMDESNNLNKKTLIFVFTSISTGGGLTFLKHLTPLSSNFNLKYYSIKPLADYSIVKPYKKAKFSDFINKNSIFIANSQVALFFCLACQPFSEVFYITHGYANAYPFITNFRNFYQNLFIILYKEE